MGLFSVLFATVSIVIAVIKAAMKDRREAAKVVAAHRKVHGTELGRLKKAAKIGDDDEND